ncbi:hypothetical protein ASG39_18400 [Rhizobium sp. Leaf371]|nr:hypothetical protein ASG39_18400 [Rhizobium sp. Leaf371]
MRETDFGDRTTEYVLDRANRVVEAMQPDGRIVAYQWDRAGRVVSRSAVLPGRTEASQLETFDYDDVGRPSLAKNAETGLHHNRFRIYDPSIGQYFSLNPIGLLGGLRPHGYGEIPTWWADPVGLYGVYVFQVQRNGRCFVGKGEQARMLASMRYRSGALNANDARTRCPRGLYTNTDAGLQQRA